MDRIRRFWRKRMQYVVSRLSFPSQSLVTRLRHYMLRHFEVLITSTDTLLGAHLHGSLSYHCSVWLLFITYDDAVPTVFKRAAPVLTSKASKCIHTKIVTPMLQFCACRSEEDIHSPLPLYKQRCFIVFESVLMLLGPVCSCCRNRYTRVSKTVIGSFLRITQSCSRCGYRFIWDCQPYIGSTPVGNILILAAI